MAKFSDNSMAGIVWDKLTMALGALAAGDVTNANSKIDSSRLQGFRVLRTEYFITWREATSGEGPIIVGMAHDLSNDETKETWSADPQRKGDPEADSGARVMRPVWPLEAFLAETAGGRRVAKGVVKIGWSFPEGTPLKWWVLNQGIILTNGSDIDIIAKHYGVWLKD